jgi:N utilization substance protein B
MKRRKTRELVIKALFAYEIEKGNPLFHLEYISQDAEMAGYDEGTFDQFLSGIEDEFARKLTAGIIEQSQVLDSIIKKYAVDWDIERLGGTDRNILRLAVYEMLYMEKLHPAIAINEAVDLAKQFGSKESPRFINGILGQIANDQINTKQTE